MQFDVSCLDFDEPPSVFARPPAMWFPGPVQQRVAQTFIVLVERAHEAESAGGTLEIKAHQLL